MRSYYDLTEYVSNSDLGALNDMIANKQAPAGLQHIFDFGNLVDASISEKHKVDKAAGVLYTDGAPISFSADDMRQAELMQRAFDADPYVCAMFARMRWQHIILRKQFEVQHEEVAVILPARCKFDGLDKAASLGGDIKTTAATTQQQFMDAFYFFNYDRQCAWYMDLARIDRMIYAGISKKKQRNGLPLVFTHAVTRGDECYKSGLAKYQRTAVKYYYLIHQLFN